jgi:hypothetical protein
MKFTQEPQAAGFKRLTCMHRLTDSTAPFLISVPTQKAYKPELQTMNLNKALHFIWQSWILFRVKNVILGEAPSLSYGCVSLTASLFSSSRYDSSVPCLFNDVAFKLRILYSVEIYGIV